MPMLKVVTFIMVALAAVAWFRGHGQCLEGLRLAGKKLLEVLPLLLAGFVVAGMMKVLLPGELVVRWLGAGAGMKGVWLGCLAGGPCPPLSESTAG
ncbi:MAG: hypothetical protein K6T75_03490 [Acetobacteraceae bacterium]|nr:hypothetical protein [Acetobacteraceae bacterium]